jgi:hypothetical protein
MYVRQTLAAVDAREPVAVVATVAIVLGEASPRNEPIARSEVPEPSHPGRISVDSLRSRRTNRAVCISFVR